MEMSLGRRVPWWKAQCGALLGERETNLSLCLRWIPVSASRGQGRYVLGSGAPSSVLPARAWPPHEVSFYT